MIEAVIFDWAGTTVDFGCMAPIDAFNKAFLKEEISLTDEEIRKPMGMKKWDHIKVVLEEERVKKEWAKIYSSDPKKEDIDRIHETFEDVLFKNLRTYSSVKPGTNELIENLRKLGIKIGSTTGYNDEMMEVVKDEAEKQGYKPDCIATADDTNGYGRPYPYMIFKNMEKLLINDVRKVIKVGDTVSDIKEGNSAGVVSVGVIEGSSLAGLSYEEYISLSREELYQLNTKVRAKYLLEGADFVIEKIGELVNLIKMINSQC